jgi:hypothetical protein
MRQYEFRAANSSVDEQYVNIQKPAVAILDNRRAAPCFNPATQMKQFHISVSPETADSGINKLSSFNSTPWGCSVQGGNLQTGHHGAFPEHINAEQNTAPDIAEIPPETKSKSSILQELQ